MKKLLLLLLLVTQIPISTDAQIVKFRARTFTYTYKNCGKLEKIKSNTDILVTIDMDRSKAHFYAKEESDYDLIKLVNEWTDEQGNVHGKYNALNETGEKCTFEMVMFKSTAGYVASIGIVFKDRGYIYKLESD